LKSVEPFFKPETPVLEYAPPEPRKSLIERIRGSLDSAVDFVGGPVTALWIGTILCFGFGTRFPGLMGSGMIILSGVTLRFMLHEWYRRSKW